MDKQETIEQIAEIANKIGNIQAEDIANDIDKLSFTCIDLDQVKAALRVAALEVSIAHSKLYGLIEELEDERTNPAYIFKVKS